MAKNTGRKDTGDGENLDDPSSQFYFIKIIDNEFEKFLIFLSENFWAGSIIQNLLTSYRK